MPADRLKVNGVVLGAMNVGEADRRLVLLTGELGKIHVFVRGAKRPKSPYGAACDPFVFGTFELYEGRTAYTLSGVSVMRYFEELKQDYDSICVGSYLLELADYFGRENVEAADQVNLIYVSLLALLNDAFSNTLVRSAYELRTLVNNGEYPDVFSCRICGRDADLPFFSVRRNGCLCADCASSVPGAVPLKPGTLQAMRHIVRAPLRSLYSFRIPPEAEENLKSVMKEYLARIIDRPLRTAAFLPD